MSLLLRQDDSEEMCQLARDLATFLLGKVPSFNQFGVCYESFSYSISSCTFLQQS